MREVCQARLGDGVRRGEAVYLNPESRGLSDSDSVLGVRHTSSGKSQDWALWFGVQAS